MRSDAKPKSDIRKSKRRKRKATTPGPKPSITVAVVKRVGSRYARGVPLEHALAAEGNSKINLETWKKALAAHPELSPHWDGCKGKFLDWATARLAKARKLNFLCYLLERRHPDLFARPAAVAVNVSNNNTVVGLPEDILEQMRAAARELARTKPADANDKTKGTHGT